MKRNVPTICGILITALTWFSGCTAWGAADIQEGRKLYEANCFRCHDSKIHTRPDSIIHSYAALQRRVKFCESINELEWSDEQLEDVAAYLNQAFYKFKH